MLLDSSNNLGSKSSSWYGLVLSIMSALVAEMVLVEFEVAKDGPASICRVLILLLCFLAIHRFGSLSLRYYRPGLKELLTLHIVIISSVLMVWIGRVLALGLESYFANGSRMFSQPISAASLNFAIPFSVGGLVLQSVLGLHYVLVFAISFALLIGIYNPGSVLFVPMVLIATLVGAMNLAHFRRRSAYFKAGCSVTLAMLPFALSAGFVGTNLLSTDGLIRVFAVLVSGILCTFIAAGVTPLIEHLGGYVTDMRLIEMATLDHPLLKDLSVQAPGTWNHSMVMGMMGEAAASQIDANTVLTRVGAYFHDIGKIKKPLYFVENQAAGENRHDKLSPSMSALIIRSHVKDGVELARLHKLPKAIEDMIPQHHGTSMIEYFYNKAVKEAGENAEIDKSLYSYPGPKPQTREAGILMLADGIEASARTLSEPTPDRIQGLVQKMINKIFSSGELNECDLTLKDLHEIAKCFTRVLTGIYHQRVAYAEPAEKVNVEEAASKDEPLPRAAANDSPLESENEGDKPKEKLKRLGM